MVAVCGDITNVVHVYDLMALHGIANYASNPEKKIIPLLLHISEHLQKVE